MRALRVGLALALVSSAGAALVVGSVLAHEAAHCASYWARGGLGACHVTLYRPGEAYTCTTSDVCMVAPYRPGQGMMLATTTTPGELPAWEHPALYAAHAASALAWLAWSARRVRRASARSSPRAA